MIDYPAQILLFPDLDNNLAELFEMFNEQLGEGTFEIAQTPPPLPSTLKVTFRGYNFQLIGMPMPIPKDTFNLGLAMNADETLQEAIQSHLMHVIVSPDVPDGQSPSVVEVASKLMTFAAVFADMTTMSAVYWEDSKMLLSAPQAVEIYKNMTSDESLGSAQEYSMSRPWDFWSGFFPQHKDEQAGLVTQGLEPFFGANIYAEPQDKVAFKELRDGCRTLLIYATINHLNFTDIQTVEIPGLGAVSIDVRDDASGSFGLLTLTD